MKIAIEGCAHGELENIYDTIEFIEEVQDIKVDLLICCGDFQSSRNETDLMCMAVPPKYKSICTFYKYYSGEKTAPVLTIFIGGNHEASNYLQELPYGGWVAPNIYYLGYAGVINIAGLRIAGLSGIYKSGDYLRGHHEKPPYDEYTRRSVYHVRNLEVFRLKQISNKIDIFLSHDWPSDVYKYGNVEQLLKQKPHFREDIEKKELGSKACQELLHHLKPKHWFSAHLHCKFAAVVEHEDNTTTKFLALDKCLPKRKFLQVVDVDTEESKLEISYDLEWLTVLYSTNHLLWVKPTHTYMPGPGTKERCDFTPTDEEMRLVSERFNNDLVVPKDFAKTAPAYDPSSPAKGKLKPARASLNPQTASFCKKLAVDDPLSLVIKLKGHVLKESEVTAASSFPSEDFNTTATSFIDDTLDTEELNSFQNSPMKRRLNLSLPDPKADSIDETKEQEEAEWSLTEPCDASSLGSGEEQSESGGEPIGLGDASNESGVAPSEVGNASLNESGVEPLGAGDASSNESGVGGASCNGLGAKPEGIADDSSNGSGAEPEGVGLPSIVSRIESIGVGDGSLVKSGVGSIGVDGDSSVEPEVVVSASSVHSGAEALGDDGVVEESKLPTPPKKLRRRNIEMYRSDDTKD